MAGKAKLAAPSSRSSHGIQLGKIDIAGDSDIVIPANISVVGLDAVEVPDPVFRRAAGKSAAGKASKPGAKTDARVWEDVELRVSFIHWLQRADSLNPQGSQKTGLIGLSGKLQALRSG